MQALAIVESIAKDLSDISYVTWSKIELTEYLNSALRRICLARADASSAVETVKLVAGTKQSIPASSRRLLDIVRNMGSDGTTAGKVITSVDMNSLSLYRPSWHTDTAKTAIKHFMYDDIVPKTFYVTPPVHATTNVYVEIKVSKNPVEISNVETDAISIEDVYEPAIRHWMLYRALSKETDASVSIQEAAMHMAAFNEVLGIKGKTDLTFSPSVETQEGKA